MMPTNGSLSSNNMHANKETKSSNDTLNRSVQALDTETQNSSIIPSFFDSNGYDSETEESKREYRVYPYQAEIEFEHDLLGLNHAHMYQSGHNALFPAYNYTTLAPDVSGLDLRSNEQMSHFNHQHADSNPFSTHMNQQTFYHQNDSIPSFTQMYQRLSPMGFYIDTERKKIYSSAENFRQHTNVQSTNIQHKDSKVTQANAQPGIDPQLPSPDVTSGISAVPSNSETDKDAVQTSSSRSTRSLRASARVNLDLSEVNMLKTTRPSSSSASETPVSSNKRSKPILYSAGVAEANALAAESAQQDIEEYLMSRNGQRLTKKDRNKLSSMKYRKKRKLLLGELEEKVASLEQDLQVVESSFRQLTDQNRKMKYFLQKYQSIHGLLADPSKPNTYFDASTLEDIDFDTLPLSSALVVADESYLDSESNIPITADDVYNAANSHTNLPVFPSSSEDDVNTRKSKQLLHQEKMQQYQLHHNSQY